MVNELITLWIANKTLLIATYLILIVYPKTNNPIANALKLPQYFDKLSIQIRLLHTCGVRWAASVELILCLLCCSSAAGNCGS